LPVHRGKEQKTFSVVAVSITWTLDRWRNISPLRRRHSPGRIFNFPITIICSLIAWPSLAAISRV